MPSRPTPGSGGLSQSAVNDEAGARTQLSSVVCAGVVVLVLTVLTGVLDDLAQATLGALVVVAAAGLIKPAALRLIARVRTRDFVLALVALAGVLVLGVLQGVLVAVAASIATFIYQANKPPVEVVDGMPDGMLVVRPAGRLYAANAKNVTAKLAAIADAADPRPEVVVLDAVAIPDLEYTALVALRELGDEARERGLARWVAGMRPEQLRMLERFGLGPDVRIFATLDDAVAAFKAEHADRP